MKGILGSIQLLTGIAAFHLDGAPPASSAARGQDRVPSASPPTPAGSGETTYVSVLAKLLCYCLYLLPE